jgi:hypothetical protein
VGHYVFRNFPANCHGLTTLPETFHRCRASTIRANPCRCLSETGNSQRREVSVRYRGRCPVAYRKSGDLRHLNCPNRREDEEKAVAGSAASPVNPPVFRSRWVLSGRPLRAGRRTGRQGGTDAERPGGIPTRSVGMRW